MPYTLYRIVLVLFFQYNGRTDVTSETLIGNGRREGGNVMHMMLEFVSFTNSNRIQGIFVDIFQTIQHLQM